MIITKLPAVGELLEGSTSTLNLLLLNPRDVVVKVSLRHDPESTAGSQFECSTTHHLQSAIDAQTPFEFELSAFEDELLREETSVVESSDDAAEATDATQMISLSSSPGEVRLSIPILPISEEFKAACRGKIIYVLPLRMSLSDTNPVNASAVPIEFNFTVCFSGF